MSMNSGAYFNLCTVRNTISGHHVWPNMNLLLTFNGHHDPQLSIQKLKSPFQIMLFLPAMSRISTNTLDLWMKKEQLMYFFQIQTIAPGYPVCVSKRSSCSPKWTTPGSAFPLHHGHFLCKHKITGLTTEFF